jgi:hypothetical protein
LRYLRFQRCLPCNSGSAERGAWQNGAAYLPNKLKNTFKPHFSVSPLTEEALLFVKYLRHESEKWTRLPEL